MQQNKSTVNLRYLEHETWAERERSAIDPIEVVNGSRVDLFQMIGVPDNVIDQMLFSRHFIEVRDEIKTIEGLRPFNSLPKWLKKRIKYRLNHITQFPELQEFISNLQ